VTPARAVALLLFLASSADGAAPTVIPAISAVVEAKAIKEETRFDRVDLWMEPLAIAS